MFKGSQASQIKSGSTQPQDTSPDNREAESAAQREAEEKEDDGTEKSKIP